MNRISGRVVLRESGVGIPDLLVVLYDLDPGTKPEEVIDERSASRPGDRLAALLTRHDGGFSVDLEDVEFQIRNRDERRPDLVLQVLAPEEPGMREEQRILYASNAIRQNAGRIEEYLVRLGTDQLVKAGLPVPAAAGTPEPEPAAGRVRRMQADVQRSSALVDGMLEVARERVEAHRQRFQARASAFGATLGASLSTVAAASLEPERRVQAGDSPVEKAGAVIRQDIRDVLNSDDPSVRAPARGYISLTDEQVVALRAQVDADGTIDEAAIAGTGGETRALLRTPLLPLCRSRSASTDACTLALAEGGTTPTLPVPVENGGAVPTMHAQDIPPFVRRLVDPLTAPEELLLTGLTPTATLASVQESVRNLVLEPSPADAPAYHEFSQLQIAFRHVWQELTDKGVLDLAANAYETIVELGGDPERPEHRARPPIEAIAAEAQLALRAANMAPPPVVRDHRGGDQDPSSAPGGVVVGPASRPPRDHRTGADPAVADADPVVRLPALLAALDARMREKYAFTVYAANAQERSVNFGILTTFQQMWRPLSYQAGQLIKSVPLAPRQTQKVVVTRKVSKKRHQKELETNLRVVREETSQTNRAEQEIARRASMKTEFSYSNTASGGVEGVGSDTSTTTFKQDASRSSDDIKKSFRESVFKSAQEFKNERTTEVTTDYTEENETTEATEISNPNDEIAVTYLFYELQRRYRLHERLHRVTPVVLVAQEVPSPDEIDADWLVAHDWILKREILDDSFLPTLETLSQSAGNETALQQLEANVAQQRRIVASLRNELAIARRTTDTHDTLWQRALGRRTGSPNLVGAMLDMSLLDDAVGKVGDLLFGGGADASQANQNALKQGADEAADRARDLAFRLEREVTALNAITETFAKALREHHTHLTEIARLRVHVKENILHYMQGIWRHEHPDQRFFRLHNVPVPTLRKVPRRLHVDFDRPLAAVAARPHEALPRFGGRDAKLYPAQIHCRLPDVLEYKPLCQVAAIDQWLGCKGNYMVFPLLASNPITDFMMAPYIDRATGELLDPADPAGCSVDEFADYVCCLRKELEADEFERLKPALKERFEALLTASRRSDDILVVPTNSLFIEALPAAHALIEKFKKDHRMIDVKRAQAEVRKLEMENLRYAARVLSDEREDPEIEQRVLVQGQVPPVVVPTPQP